MLTPAGSMLTNESVCEIMQSCFRICFEMRLSGMFSSKSSSFHRLNHFLFTHNNNLRVFGVNDSLFYQVLNSTSNHSLIYKNNNDS